MLCGSMFFNQSGIMKIKIDHAATKQVHYVVIALPVFFVEIFIGYQGNGTTSLYDNETTPDITSSSGEPSEDDVHIRPIEVILVASILLSWLLAVMMFLRQWGTLRLSSSGEGVYREAKSFKNLDSVKVVSGADNSVISFSHSKSRTRTMEARQKRLDQIHTMPDFAAGQHVSGCCTGNNSSTTFPAEPSVPLQKRDTNLKPGLSELLALQEPRIPWSDWQRPRHVFADTNVTSEGGLSSDVLSMSDLKPKTFSFDATQTSAQWRSMQQHSSCDQVRPLDVVFVLDDDYEATPISNTTV